MAVKHHVIKPVRHAGIASQDRIYPSGGAIVEGAPVIFEAATGKVIEITDLDAGGGLLATGKIVGIALNAVTASNQDVLVALAFPGCRFAGSYTGLATAVGSDAGATAITYALQGTRRELHKDDTTLKWVLGAVAGAVGTNAAPLIFSFVDKIGATTNDTPGFGAVGSGPGFQGTVTPFTTFNQDPTGSNTGKAIVEFIFPTGDTIFG